MPECLGRVCCISTSSCSWVK